VKPFTIFSVTAGGIASSAAPWLCFNGGYVEVSWVFTGELHPYDAKKVSWGRSEVDHLFSFEDGGIGAWELAARYCTVSLNSDVISRVPESVTGGVYGGQQQIAALSLIWYPNNRLRFMLQFQYVDVNKLNPAGKILMGQRFPRIAGRVQVTW
jgi:phosphate-selective porin OprO/OprP